MYYVYILENESGRHYIGSCEDIKERLKQHNQNEVSSTKNKGPFRVIYSEEFDNKKQARIRENRIKSYKGGEAFKRLINIVPIV